MSEQDNSEQYRVWWIPNLPGPQFQRDVDSPAQARALLESLAAYDLFLLENSLRADFSNVGGLLSKLSGDEDVPGNWMDWESLDGDDIWNVELEHLDD